jgi:hypothetical protein
MHLAALKDVVGARLSHTLTSISLHSDTCRVVLHAGDVADEIRADLVVLHSEAVHAKHVDANLLAEFVPCPVLLLP